MPKLPRIKSKQLIKALLKAGFFVDHITGSHYILYKNDNSQPVSVPHHNRDLKIGTLKNIMRQTDISLAQLIEFLNK